MSYVHNNLSIIDFDDEGIVMGSDHQACNGDDCLSEGWLVGA